MGRNVKIFRKIIEEVVLEGQNPSEKEKADKYIEKNQFILKEEKYYLNTFQIIAYKKYEN